MRPRVLHVVSSLGVGGAETWLLRLQRHWSAVLDYDSPEIDFLVTGGEVSVLDDELRALGSRIFYLDLRRGKIFRFVIELRQVLRNSNYIAIHDHQDCLAGWHFLFGVGLLPKVCVVHVHNPSYQLRSNYGISTRRRLQLIAGKILLRCFSTHVFGTSLQLLREYGIGGIGWSRQYVGAHYCSFDVSEFMGSHHQAKIALCNEVGWSTDCKLLLFAGRLDYSIDINHPQNHKNSAFALSILNSCKNLNSNVKMVMAGSNIYIKHEFQRLIDTMGLSDSVKLLGIRRDISHLMIAADGLLFPSRAEGLGMVAVEAQASGLPVFMSDAVPEECIVIDELIHRIGLHQSPDEWARVITEELAIDRVDVIDCDSRWGYSGFNIEVGAQRLANVYKEKLFE